MTYLGNEMKEVYCSECDFWNEVFEEYTYSTSQFGALLVLQECCTVCGHIVNEQIIDKDI